MLFLAAPLWWLRRGRRRRRVSIGFFFAPSLRNCGSANFSNRQRRWKSSNERKFEMSQWLCWNWVHFWAHRQVKSRQERRRRSRTNFLNLIQAYKTKRCLVEFSFSLSLFLLFWYLKDSLQGWIEWNGMDWIGIRSANEERDQKRSTQVQLVSILEVKMLLLPSLLSSWDEPTWFTKFSLLCPCFWFFQTKRTVLVHLSTQTILYQGFLLLPFGGPT